MQYNSYDYNFDCNNNYKPFKTITIWKNNNLSFENISY